MISGFHFAEKEELFKIVSFQRFQAFTNYFQKIQHRI